MEIWKKYYLVHHNICMRYQRIRTCVCFNVQRYFFVLSILEFRNLKGLVKKIIHKNIFIIRTNPSWPNFQTQDSILVPSIEIILSSIWKWRETFVQSSLQTPTVQTSYCSLPLHCILLEKLLSFLVYKAQVLQDYLYLSCYTVFEMAFFLKWAFSPAML